MGCECWKIKNLETEIITTNKEEKYILLKSEKKEQMRNTDTYINSIKTADKNSLIIQPSNTENNTKNEKKVEYSKQYGESYNQKFDENINEIKSSNKNVINNNENTNLKNKQININKFNSNKSKTKSKIKTNSKKNSFSKIPIDEFSQYIFNHINQIRENPQSFIDTIEEAKLFIEYNKSHKLIYKKNQIKVALSQGLPAFEEAMSILKITKPMNKLIFEPKLMVKLPENEEDMVKKNYFKSEIKKMEDKGIFIKGYWRDIIKEPETSFLMMIVDDTGIKAGMKRKDILDPNMKYIGICSKNIEKKFICFVTFSDIKVD